MGLVGCSTWGSCLFTNLADIFSFVITGWFDCLGNFGILSVCVVVVVV